MSIFRDGILDGKTAFVTGGTSGINLAIAKRLLKAGAKVAVFGRNEERGAAAVAELTAHVGSASNVRYFSGDVRKYETLEAAFAGTVAAFGPIDILVNGAAGNFPCPAVAMSPNAFKSVVEIDLLGSYHACRAAFPHLTKPGGVVLSISAPQAFVPAPMQAHVCAAKAGVDMLTKVLAMEWGPMGVRVNAIVPGPVDGTEGMKRLAGTDEMREKVSQGLALRRFASLDEMAEAALFLCTDAASYVTGSIFVADGGQSLYGLGMLMNF
jgi:NAD(P)-dependent dehydrogenase (short-subunit alcohol dehydrogenase family)